MIEKTPSFKTSDGQIYPDLEKAQAHEIEILLPGAKNGAVGYSADELGGIIVGCKDKIVDILTTGPRSKPKARKINGGTKKRAAATPTPAPAE